MKDKKTIFSGMQPSGFVTLGNYLGAINNWKKLQDEYNCFYCIVDMHAITVRQEPAKLRKQTRDVLMQYIACGLDPEKNVIYVQSHVPQHCELQWILGCFTYMGELNRMTQFKEKSNRHADNINAGLFTYPVLQAADILLYQADLVPVGEDQRQHLELSRDIAIRVNKLYENLFTVPEMYISKVGAKIMSLQEPEKKMSKSDENPNGVIALFDEPNVILNKVKRAVTDSDADIRYNVEEKPGVSNLMNIYAIVTNQTVSDVEKEFEGQGYGAFKKAVGEALVEHLRPIQTKFKDLQNNKDYIDQIMKTNAEKASYVARRTMSKVYKKMGFIPRG